MSLLFHTGGPHFMTEKREQRGVKEGLCPHFFLFLAEKQPHSKARQGGWQYNLIVMAFSVLVMMVLTM